jgi:hypothetical protein
VTCVIITQRLAGTAMGSFLVHADAGALYLCFNSVLGTFMQAQLEPVEGVREARARDRTRS